MTTSASATPEPLTPPEPGTPGGPPPGTAVRLAGLPVIAAESASDISSSRYWLTLAGLPAGAKVGTISRRLSTIRFAHKVRNHPDPTQTARVIAVWEGIRRQLGAPPDQARTNAASRSRSGMLRRP